MSQGEAMDCMKMEPFVQKVMTIPDAKLDNWLIANTVKYNEVIEFRHVYIAWLLKQANSASLGQMLSNNNNFYKP